MFPKTYKETGVAIKLKKFKFAHPEVKFCGKIVESGVKEQMQKKLLSSVT